ncbi:hypothetical protein C1H46_014184 [Malus baccata]|uniref:Kinesin motor domain-containing protein n=1 Tax=Malus baccata TaxID=106549 RepID=A0A540MN51_MALBA|nr:hypothetical protein C1H46_014184 [Malus baccata]
MLQKTLNHTTKLLSTTEEELMKCRYALKERDFIISEQKKAENALAQEACNLQSDLEKALHDNASLFQKIGREDKLSADNRLVVNNYQDDLAKQVGSLCKMVATSMSHQNEHLQCVENLCHYFLSANVKAIMDMKNKLTSSRALYLSHIEAVQNVVRLHKASSNAGLEEISSFASSNLQSVEEFLASEAGEAATIFEDLQSSLSTQQGEMTAFAKELKQRFNSSIKQTQDISEYSQGFLHKLLEESKRLEDHVGQTNDITLNSIAEFQKAYEEQSKSEAEKLIADISSLVSTHMSRQKEMVDAKLVGFKESAIADKSFMDGHVSSMEGITTEVKRKWGEFSMQAENDAKDGADYSAAKHCRMEVLLQKSVSTADSALEHWKKTQECVNDMGNKHVSAMASLIRIASDSNKQHDVEINSVRAAVDQDVANKIEYVLQHVDYPCGFPKHKILSKLPTGMHEQEQESISKILETIKAHSNTLETLREDHSGKAVSIEETARDTFQNHYLDYEPSGSTPEKSEPEVPSKGTIESLRAMPMEALVEEFRENHSYESLNVKELKPSLIPRSPLTQLN